MPQDDATPKHQPGERQDARALPSGGLFTKRRKRLVSERYPVPDQQWPWARGDHMESPECLPNTTGAIDKLSSLLSFFFFNSLVAPTVKNPLAMQETWVQSLGVDNALEKYSCLENSMDRGTYQATVHRVAKSRTQLSTNTYIAH